MSSTRTRGVDLSQRSRTAEDIDWDELQTRIDFQFEEQEKLIQAFTRKAHAKEQIESGKKKCPHQDAYRVLGDAVLKAILVDLLMEKKKLKTRGEITEEKKHYESTEGLHKVAVSREIASFILMSRGEEITNVQDRPRVQAETLEALIGAIYRDKGFEHAKDIVATWFAL